MFCSNCGKEIDDKAAICIHCGVATGINNKEEKGNDWTTTFLLCLLLGIIGAHRFYTGYKIIGAIQLMLIVIGWVLIVPAVVGIIWVLIDFISILAGLFKTEDGRELIK